MIMIGKAILGAMLAFVLLFAAPMARADLYTLDDVFTAINTGDLGAIEQFLKQGMDPNIQTQDGNTDLIMAAREGHAGIVKLLLANGAKVYARNRLDENAAMLAAYQGHNEVIDLLVAWGAQMNPNRKGWTPLTYASYGGKCETVSRLLLAYAAPVDEPINTGMSALMLAAKEGHTACVKSLLSAGANPNVRAGPRRTALQLARKGGHTDIVELLEDAGAKK